MSSACTAAVWNMLNSASVSGRRGRRGFGGRSCSILGRELRGCHSRDIVEAAVDILRSDGSRNLTLTAQVIDEACAAYFL
jgi:hypothetical protein